MNRPEFSYRTDRLALDDNETPLGVHTWGSDRRGVSIELREGSIVHVLTMSHECLGEIADVARLAISKGSVADHLDFTIGHVEAILDTLQRLKPNPAIRTESETP